jgi:hypothetical protein
VWWIGIGHAGTLISAILLLLRQDWRTSINRFAEAMTLFAVACAVIFPVVHTGRPWLAAYWLFPYPNTMGLWPNFPAGRSAAARGGRPRRRGARRRAGRWRPPPPPAAARRGRRRRRSDGGDAWRDDSTAGAAQPESSSESAIRWRCDR